MGRLFTSGFEENTNTVNVEWTGTNGSPTIQTGTTRTGTYAGQITSLVSGTALGWFYQFSSANVSTDTYIRFYINIAVYPNADTQIMCLLDSTGNDPGDIRLTSTGTMYMTDNTGSQVGSASSALSLNTWHRIELRYFNTSSTEELKIDGSSISLSTTISGQVYREAHFGGNLNGGISSTGTWYLDDIAINDTGGTTQNSYPGSGQVVTLRPNAAGDNNAFTVQIGGTAGAANNFTRVKEVTPDDATSYNGAVTSGTIDDFNIDDTPAVLNSTSTITLVQLNVRYRAVVAASEAAFKTRIKKAAAGTVASSTAITPNSTTWKTNTNAVPNLPPQTLYLDPDSGAWTKATLDTTQIGYTISTTNTNAADISAVWLNVEFVPGATATASGSTLQMMGVG